VPLRRSTAASTIASAAEQIVAMAAICSVNHSASQKAGSPAIVR
jgi:hypothetical protein